MDLKKIRGGGMCHLKNILFCFVIDALEIITWKLDGIGYALISISPIMT